MKKKIKKAISVALLCIILAGCSNSVDSHIIYSGASNCPISTLRTGTERQGIRTYGNGFECTDTGSYFMCNVQGVSWLLYADHGSDTLIKLCGRPDCNHTDSDCNAYFDFAASICYYDGFLYTVNEKASSAVNDKDLIRMNLDGTERTIVYNTFSFATENGYSNIVNTRIFNGVLFFLAGKLDEKGETIFASGYYKLDGSMDEPKIGTFNEIYVKADGEHILAPFYDKESDIFTYCIWEPEKGVVTELFKCNDIKSYGYIGTKANYYVEDGIIIEDSYTEGKKELLDTGLKGNYQLVCFPDCMVVYECIPTGSGITLEESTLHFYSWNCNDLGSVKINYKFHGGVLGAGLICGETPERIILTDHVDFAPRYYINKSDLGTGNIEIHPFKLPEGMQSEFMEGDKLEDNN